MASEVISPKDSMSRVSEASTPTLSGLSAVVAAMNSVFSVIGKEQEDRLASFRIAIEPLIAFHQERTFEPVQEAINRICGAIAAFQRVHFESPLHSFIQSILHESAVAKPVQPRVIDGLLRRAWYHSYHFTDRLIIGLDDLFQRQEFDQVDLVMTDFARLQLERIRKALQTGYPDRASILSDAFDAHSSGKYSLSIPVFLIQADGIGRDVLGTNRDILYKKESQRKSALDSRLQSFKVPGLGRLFYPDSIQGRMLSPLEKQWSLAVTTEEQANSQLSDPFYGPLNRHGVLHGIDTHYPTEVNSCRCILLLGFLLDVRSILHEELPKEYAEMCELFSKRTNRESSPRC